MKVVPVAATEFFSGDAAQEMGYQPHGTEGTWVSDLDELPEAAGRLCYKAWERKNPKTQTNDGYLGQIIDHGHFSVLEHSSVSFYIEGVSRSLLAELTRHRHLSFSVVSQRYVRLTAGDITVHPTVEEYKAVPLDLLESFWTVGDEVDAAVRSAVQSYNDIANALLREGLPKKKALEAARTVLPSAMDSPMVVTGNLRAWRDVMGKRYDEHADEEIKQLATEVLRHLRAMAPSSFQDFPEEPFS